MRPALRSGPLSMPATAQIVALPPVSADTSGLAVPNSAVRFSFGKNSALATPMRALAPTSCCSAWRRSGRRSSSADGSPAGTVGTTACAYIGSPRGMGMGLRPSRMLIWFSFATISLSISGMVACAAPSAPSARAVSSFEATPIRRRSSKTL